MEPVHNIRTEMEDDREGQFEDLLKYYPLVVKLLHSLGFLHDEARDLAQDVFVRVYGHMETYRGESKAEFLKKVTRNVAFNHLRARATGKRGAPEVSVDDALELEDAGAPSPIQRLIDEERVQRLHAAIAQLDPKQQEAIRYQLSEVPLEEAARKIGITLSALKSRLHTARERLRELLGEESEGLGGGDDH